MSQGDGACDDALQRNEQPDDEAQPEQGKLEVQLTDTLRLGTQDLHSRAESIALKIADLLDVGVSRIEAIKASYINRLMTIKSDMEHMVESVDADWEQKSSESIALHERLNAVYILVDKFGLDTTGRQD